MGTSIAALLLSLPSAAQMGSADPQHRLPRHVLYFALFKHVNHLQSEAQHKALAGKQDMAADLSSYYQRIAGLTPQQDSILKAVATDCTNRVDQIDKQMRAAIVSLRAQYPNGRLPDAGSLPTVPPQLLTLQAERITLIEESIGSLKAQFGDSEFARLDDFARNRFAPQISALPLSVPNPQILRPNDYPRGGAK